MSGSSNLQSGPLQRADPTGDRGGQQFAEVVVRGVVAKVEHRADDHVVAGHAAVAARGVFAIEPSRGVHLHHRVLAGRKVIKLVIPRGVGGGPEPRVAAIGAEQPQFDAADAVLVRGEDAVVVLVMVDVARQRRPDVFTEVVVHAVLIRQQVDLGNQVVRRLTPLSADPLAAIEVLDGLVLTHLILAGPQADEAVAPLGVGRGRLDKLAIGVE